MISIWNGQKLEAVDYFTFSAGEIQVKLSDTILKHLASLWENYETLVHIKMQFTNSHDLIALMLTVNALREINSDMIINLEAPYMPFARQDRAVNEGEANASSAFINFLNSLDFGMITFWDVHNPEVLSGIDASVGHIEQNLLVDTYVPTLLYDFIVSPDKGSVRKIKKIAFDRDKILYASKVRDPKTGHITATEVSIPTDLNVVGSRVLIVDDICDGGRTFIELAKELKKLGITTVDLYVTHGIFSKGFYVFRDYIDTIYTTDSVYNSKQESFLKTINILQETT